MEKEIDDIVKSLDALRKEVDCDLVKFYFKENDDYCFKFIKNEKIVLVVRRGIKRK